MDEDLDMEQRRHSRIAVNLPARYRSGQMSLDGRVLDLSADGVHFVSGVLDEGGQTVDLELDLPDTNEPVRITGEVRWHTHGNQAGMGIHFTDVPKSDRRRLANFVIHRTYRRL
jgi:c-di-GMP-binding flagellar brake protein YcgR